VEDDPLRYFRIEARELHDGLTEGLLRLERGALDAEGLRRLRRQAHTLKGAARVVREALIAEQAHRMEDTLAGATSEGGVAPGDMAAALEALDAIGARLAELTPAVPRAAAPSEPQMREGTSVVRLEVRDLEALSGTLSAASARIASAGKLGPHLARARRGTSEVLDRLERERTLAVVRGQAPNDALIQRMEATSAALGELERELTWMFEGLATEVRGAREELQRLRLIPVDTLFAQLQRAVRDAAAVLGRSVRLELSGAEAKVDAPVLSLAREALLHLVRNAVAHGIEPPEVRRRLGKPAEGVIRLRVQREGGRIAFSCRDDGAGIDPGRVRAAAVAGGLLTAEAAAALSREELLQVLLRPGFSTQAAVDEVAGRGVGLNVVQKVTVQLGGDLRLDSQPGAWTEFTLSVPPSLASIRVLAVEADGARVLVPIDAVCWTARVAPGDIAYGPEGETLSHQGEAVAFAPLSRLLGRHPAADKVRAALLLQSGRERAAVGVERMTGLVEVLLLPLPPSAPAVPLLMGAALDARGDPDPILEPQALIAAVTRSAPPARKPAVEPPLVLVVDDSLTTRMLEKSILESAGYRVELATEGEEALARAAALRPDAMLVDVEMPGIDGFEVVRRLREDKVLHTIPAVLVTSRRSPEDRRRGIEVGARAYVVKSEFSQERLLEILRGLVGPSAGEGTR
jgi:two-component system, chemotaxis family, sensor kinase CheA